MPRVYERRFDWDEARRLREEGLSFYRIGKMLGVSGSAVRQVVVPGERERATERSAARRRSGTCPDCGGQSTLKPGFRSCRCMSCAADAKVAVVDGRAKCSTCDQWKPLRDFSPSRSRGRRPVHGECRACQTKRRREWRQRKRAEGAKNP